MHFAWDDSVTKHQDISAIIIMPQWAELQRHMIVIVFVPVSLCVILQHAFLHDCNESCNATTA